MKKWWIGCSGFYYKHWKERFYPVGLPRRRWFEFYCDHFNTLEINSSFYRYPRLPMLQDWYKRSPDHFRFVVKVPRFITHFRKFHHAHQQVTDFYNVIANGLEDKLGAVLFQLPPDMVYTPENLQRIMDVLDPAFDNVIEPRHASWWSKNVMDKMKDEQITFCSLSYPGLADEVVRTSSSVYYRFHGVPELYLSPYSEVRLRLIAGKIQSMKKVQNVYCYFNNDIAVEAITNALMLRHIAEPGISKPSTAFLSEKYFTRKNK